MTNIEKALLKLENIVMESGNDGDRTYFQFHKRRFKRMAETVTTICKPGSLVLDIGSHYLHSSLLLSFLGYKVISMDVAEFCELRYIQQRAFTWGLTQITENNLEKMPTLSGEENVYDLILFTEIFEHITFNPIDFWKKIHTIIKHNGLIYITTPNSLTLFSMAKTIINLIRLRGIGTDLNAIFTNVTYGHHWKEYSSSEIRAYFKKMNDGFKVSIEKFYYVSYTPDSLKSWFRVILIKISNWIPYLREAIEAVVSADKSFPWKVDSPKY